MKSKLLLLALLIVSITKTFSQSFQWVNKYKASQYETIKGVATDGAGNVYVTGSFKGTVTFGSSVFNSGGTFDGFIAKYDANGGVTWAKQIFCAGDNNNDGICVDQLSNTVYITGSMDGQSTFGTTTVAPGSGSYVFVAKYDTQGNVKWVSSSQPNVSCDNFSRSVVTDASGNVFATGMFSCNMTIGTSSLTASGGLSYDMFLVKYDSTGAFQWVQQGGSTADDEGNGVCVDASGNIYVAGGFGGASAIFGSITANSYGNGDIFLAKYNSSGVIQFVEHAGGVDADKASAICTDGSGNIYIAGTANHATSLSTTFGTHTLNGVGYDDIFLAKYNSLGTAQWVVGAGNANSGEGADGLATDASGNIYLSGDFGFSATFGTTTLNAQGIFDGFVAQCNSSGVFQWAKQIGSTGSDQPVKAISVDASGNVYAVGLLDNNSATIGGITLSDTLGGIYLAKINQGTSSIGDADRDYDNDDLFAVFPNPSHTGIVNIVATNLLENYSYQVIVLSAVGQTVYSTMFNSQANVALPLSIDLSSQPKGIYFVRLMSDNVSSVQKVIID